MKPLLTFLLLSPLMALGATKEKPGLLVKTALSYQLGSKQVNSTKEFILDQGMKSWVNLTNPKDGVMVLGKVKKSDGKAVSMEFIVLDSTREPSVIATPEIRMKLGESTTIGVDNQKDMKVSLGLIASKTKFH